VCKLRQGVCRFRNLELETLNFGTETEFFLFFGVRIADFFLWKSVSLAFAIGGFMAELIRLVWGFRRRCNPAEIWLAVRGDA